MHVVPDDFKDHDIAASQLSCILRTARIAHAFVGGYAASLLGCSRVPKVGLHTQQFPHLIQNKLSNAHTGNRSHR